MSKTDDRKSCQTICWLLSGIAGLCIAVIVGVMAGGILAAIVGVLAMVGCGAFLQRHVCGLALNDWGPFEGLKGVPGWDEDGPHDPPTEPKPASVAERAHDRGPTVTSTLLSGEEALASKKGEWRYQP